MKQSASNRKAEIELGNMSGDAKVLCQQCNDKFIPEDLKPIYDEELEICGYVCNPCHIKGVEFARKCQITDCKTRPDIGPTGFRTLPSKFYDLPEGEVKKRIIKRFGIIKNVRACCNMCYVLISKAIVQIKIVYGDGFGRDGKMQSPSKTGKHALVSSTQVTEATKAPQVKEDRLAEYTGPKFTRRSGGPSWDRNKFQSVEIKATPTNIGELNTTSLVQSAEKQKDENTEDDKKFDNSRQATSLNLGEKLTDLENQDENKDEDLNKHSFTTKDLSQQLTRPDGLQVTNDVDVSMGDPNRNDKKEKITYSSTPISPTSMRFRRIVPKMPKFEGFDLSDDSVDFGELSNPASRGSRKRSRGEDDDDETWSPGRPRKEKLEGKGKFQRKMTGSDVMSDFVSCTGCRKICSSKETKPVYDEKKGCTKRLCIECIGSSGVEEQKLCPIFGCSNSGTDQLKLLPQKIHDLTGKAKVKLDSMGVTRDTEGCCSECCNTLADILDEAATQDNESEQIFTMCRNCCKIIPMKETLPNIEEGRKCGVLCQSCSLNKNHLTPTKTENIKNEGKVQKKSRLYDTTKTLGFCKAKGCIHVGETEPVQLVSGKRILRNYLDEKILRTEFDLEDDNDYCCRSCHARIKWFVADIKKKEMGPGPEGKGVKNSLKNLTPRITVKDDKQGKEGFEGNKLEKKRAKSSPQKKKKIVSHNAKEKSKFENIESPGQMRAMSSPITSSNNLLHFDSSSDAIIQSTLSPNIFHRNTQRIFSTAANTPLAYSNVASFPNSQVLNQNTVIFPSSASSSSTSAHIIIPPSSKTMATTPSGHPPLLQVGGQQFVLNVISRCEKECQTDERYFEPSLRGQTVHTERGVQANIPLMPKFEGTVPANLPNGKKVKYIDAKEKTKYGVKRAGKDLFDQFLQQLDDISGGCAQHLFADIYRPKDATMAANYEKILTSIGTLYRNTERTNRQERLRLLSTVALHAPNETLKRFFQRKSKKGDVISVNEAEIVQAREYAKQFGPGVHVVPVGQVSWNELVASTTNNPCKYESEDEKYGKEFDRKQSVSPDFVDERNKEAVHGKEGKNEEPEINTERTHIGSEGKKRVITLEKVDPDQGSIQNTLKDNSAQLVTFKVTVRQAKDEEVGLPKDSVNVKDEEVGSVEKKDDDCRPDVGNQNVGRKEISEAKVKEGIVDTKRCTPRKRNRASLIDSVTVNGKEGVKGRRRRSNIDKEAPEKGKKRSGGGRLGDKDSAGETREKRKRTAFSIERKAILEEYFEKNIYATKMIVEEISKQLVIDKKRIDNWFRNRRSKLKRDEEEKSRKGDATQTEEDNGELQKDTDMTDKQRDATMVDENVKTDTQISQEIDSSSGMSSEEGSSKGPSRSPSLSPNNLEETEGLRVMDSSVEISSSQRGLKTERKPDNMKNSNNSSSKSNHSFTEANRVLTDSSPVYKDGNYTMKSDNDIIGKDKKESQAMGTNSTSSAVSSVTKEKKEVVDDKKTPKDSSEKHPKCQENTDKKVPGKAEIEGNELVTNRSPAALPVGSKGQKRTNEIEINHEPKESQVVPKSAMKISSKVGDRDGQAQKGLIHVASEILDVKNRLKIEENQKGLSEDFEDISSKSSQIIDPNDRDKCRSVFTKENILDASENDTKLSNRKQFNIKDNVIESPLLTRSNTDSILNQAQLNESKGGNSGRVESRNQMSKQRPSDVIESSQIECPALFQSTPIWADVQLMKTKRCPSQFKALSPELPHASVNDGGISRKTVRTENNANKIWPSGEDEASYALAGIEGYAIEGVEEEPKAQDEELVLALNSDPDFMKDLNELMDIAKT